MARIRSVHPSLFTDEAWVSCSLAARILNIGLWTDADDNGVFEWKPLQLKMRLLPGDDVNVTELLAELGNIGLIRSFASDGKTFGAIKDFQKFQRPKKPRAIFPVPDDLLPYLRGEEPPRNDLFGGEPVRHQGGTGGENPPQMESEDGGWNRRMESEGTRARRKPEIRLPAGFPDADAIAKAEAKCQAARVRVDVAREATRFRGHAETHDRRCRDWAAAFRTWIDNSIERAPASNVVELSRPALSPEEEAAITLRKHRFWMDDWKKGNRWDRDIRGPQPDEPGCTVPVEIMAEFGFKPPRLAER